MKLTHHLDARSALAKTSSSPLWQDPALIAAVATPFASLAATGVAHAVGKMMEARHKTRAFKSMLQENPQLKGRDAKNTQKYFNTLWTTNPTMAKDPTVAGSFVHRQHGEGDENFPHRGIMAGAGEMAKMRKDMRSSGPSRAAMIGAQIGGAVSGIGTQLGGAQQRQLVELAAAAKREQGIVQNRGIEAVRGIQDASYEAAGFDPAAVLREATHEAIPDRRHPSSGGPRPSRPGVVRRKRVVTPSQSSLRTFLGG